MNTERMPWTCRWSEFRPASPSPLWMDEWMAQWVCLAERQKAGAEQQLDRCVDCQKFECRDERAGQPSREREI
jgi:hypothetical protein